MSQLATKPLALSAFCQNCPDEHTVREVLGQAGFSLVFQMPSSPAVPSHNLPAIPAQYHYQDRCGTQVIYLAGKDTPEGQGHAFPAHRSRWWAYPGASTTAFQTTLTALSAHWFLAWFLSHEPQGGEEEEETT